VVQAAFTRRYPNRFEMQIIKERSNRFGRHDRLTLDGQTYRVLRKERDTFSLQLVTDNLLQDYYVTKSHTEINTLRSTGRLKYERDFYSKTLSYLRLRNDNSDLSDLQEEALRTIAWKTEWCVRFNRRRSIGKHHGGRRSHPRT
jgi:hypothetical protein